MSFWHRLRSLLTGSPDVVSPVAGHPSLPAAPEDPPLELLLRYSR